MARKRKFTSTPTSILGGAGVAATTAAKKGSAKGSAGRAKKAAVSYGKAVAPTLPSGTSLPGLASPTGKATTAGAITRSTRVAARARRRQAHLINQYVTHRTADRISKHVSDPKTVERKVEKALPKIRAERNRLLNHPAVKQANRRGQVVTKHAINRIHRTNVVLSRAAEGKTPDYEIKKVIGKRAYQYAYHAAGRAAYSKDVLKEDPLAEFVIGSVATAGLGTTAKLGKVGIEAGLERLGATKAGQVAKDVRTAAKASKASKIAVRGKGLERVKRLPGAPKRAVGRAKAAPGKAKQVPKQLSTAAGRKEAATQVGAQLYSHPLIGAGAVVGSTPTGPGQRVRAAVKGTEEAVIHHPKETAVTTARAFPGIITAPAALGYSAGLSVLHGTPEPFKKTAGEQIKGVRQIAEDLLSGDPKRAQKAVQEEGALSFLAPIPAITRTHLYERARGATREAASSARRSMAESSEGAAKRLRVAPKGTEPHVFGFAARRSARKRVALVKERAEGKHRVAASRHEQAVLHGKMGEPSLSSAPEGSHVALQTALEYGIRSPEGVKFVRKHGPKSETVVEGGVNLKVALDYMEAHPEIWNDKHFKRALKAGEDASLNTPAALAGKGERARVMAHAQLFRHTDPVELVPHAARKYTEAKTRTEAWDQVKKADKEIAGLRKEAQRKKAQAQVLEGAKAKALHKQITDIRVKGKKLEERNNKLKAALDPYTRPWNKADTSSRQAYDDKMLQEHIRTVEKSTKESPLTSPVWTHHATMRQPGVGLEQTRFPAAAAQREHMRGAEGLAANDLVDRSLEAFVRGTVHMPRLRAAGKQFVRDVTRSEKLPWTFEGKARDVINGDEYAKITSPKTASNPHGGQYSRHEVGRFPLRQWNNAIKDPFTTEADLGKLLQEADENRMPHSEPGVLMSREAISEIRAQINPEHNPVTETANAFARVANRAILGTNPAWAIAQIPAEGIPLLMAHPELLNPGKVASIERDLSKYRNEHPEEAWGMEATAGAAPSSLSTPLDLQETYAPSPTEFANGAKGMTRGRSLRTVVSFGKLRALGEFDRKRQNEYRTVLLAAEADKRFRSFRSGVTDLFDRQRKISENFRGKSREELWNWLSHTKEGQREMRKLADYVDNIQGNWRAFTRYERSFAPFTIFYSFIRYSLRWTLWTFPRTHPLTATVAQLLGQANANQLEKLLGGRPSNPFAYAFPVVTSEKGKAVLPGGSRISPGQSALQQAAVTASPAQALGSLNPFLGAAITATGGPGPFGEKPSEPAGWAAIDQLLSMPAPLRIAGIKGQDITHALGLTGKAPEPSVIAKAFQMLDPNRKKRQLLLPAIPQSGAKIRMSNQLSAALDMATANSSGAQSDAASAGAKHKDILAMQKRSDSAGKTIDRILGELGLADENDADYQQYKRSLYGPPGGGASSDPFSATSGGRDPWSTAKQRTDPFSIEGMRGGKGGAAPRSTPSGPGWPYQTASKRDPWKQGVSNVKPPQKPAEHHRTAIKIGGVTSPQKTFAAELSRQTGMSPRVAAAWTKIEGGNSSGDANFLNVGHTDSGPNAGAMKNVWDNPKSAARETAAVLKGQRPAGEGVRAIISSVGQSDKAQLDAIARSGWATDPAYASKLAGTYASVTASKAPVGKAPKGKVSRLRAIKKTAQGLTNASIPYVWGGGHGGFDNPRGGLDCSGAVSYVLHKAGVLDTPLTSGNMGQALAPGPGAVTVFYNAGHTFMRIGKQYWGTSVNDSGQGGLGPHATPSAAYLNSYSVGHVPGLGTKLAAQLKIPLPTGGSSGGGITLSPDGTTATIDSGAGITQRKAGFSNKPIMPTTAQTLHLLQMIKGRGGAGGTKKLLGIAGVSPTEASQSKGGIPGFKTDITARRRKLRAS